MELDKHKGSINAVSWGSFFGRQLCSVGDDSRAIIWDVAAAGIRSEGTSGITTTIDPESWYSTKTEINNVRWCPVEPNCIAISFLNKLQLLRV
ncbi:hypothetical protein MLD38_018542 [Melastoma candidum]|uniref:Uncharacterized protein n=1 Tax=Melastoma candidum TaxID=119954 RepID=A0ACB9QW20_9MYRT|nr:hypothetical protein MLD38_018542 [Melastoma candidum]